MLTVKIDWVSLSAKVPLGDGPAEPVLLKAVQVVASLWPAATLGTARITSGRGAARWGLTWADAGVTLFAGDLSGWIALEFSGLGCETLRAAGVLDAILGTQVWRITRLDIAVDIPGGDPAAIADSANPIRFKSRATAISVSGETHYLGSRNSDRMVRVYRYALPHPRAGLCRVEFVLRNESGRKAARAILDIGLTSVAAELTRKFGFTHPALSGVGEAKPIHGYNDSERTAPGRYRWIATQALPGIARAIKEGIVTYDEIIAALGRMVGPGVDV